MDAEIAESLRDVADAVTAAFQRSPGPANIDRVVQRLAELWSHIESPPGTGGSYLRLKPRSPAAASWSHPILTFVIASPESSSCDPPHAGYEKWTIDLHAATAVLEWIERPVISRAGAKRTMEPEAQVLIDAIRSGLDHPWVQWGAKRRDLRVLINAIVPVKAAAGLTTSARRRRLHGRIARELDRLDWIVDRKKAHGWHFKRRR